MINVDGEIGMSTKLKGPELDSKTFERLRGRITTTSGIYVARDENARFILERRLAPRLRVRGVTSYSDYEKLLDGEEMDAMLDAVAVHETYFFREKRQLNLFSEHLLPQLARSERPLRIWSAGCSTGEEAFTVAMLMNEQRLLGNGRARVIASDLSHRVVEAGVRGTYTSSSFRVMDASFKKQYFSHVSKGLWTVSDLLRSSVHFEQFNLMKLNLTDETDKGRGRFDAIFCRNVLMYFEDNAAKETVKSFYRMLRGGGYLLLGHAESLLPLGTGFKTVQFGRELAHRKGEE